MKSLPTGLFLPGSSPIYRMNPNVKLLAFFLLVTAIILTNSLWGYALMIGLLVGLIWLSKIPWFAALGAVRRLWLFFLLVLLMNTSFFSTEDCWFTLWIFHPSLQGLLQGFQVVARVVLVLILSTVLTTTTAPLALTGALQWLLTPLRWIKVPTGQIAMILSVAIQFIPTIFEETDTIRKAQLARGARFDSPKLLEKAGAVLPLVIPIFLGAFKRADELSLAMEARGYRTSQSRTPRPQPAIHVWDLLALAGCLGLCVLQAYCL